MKITSLTPEQSSKLTAYRDKWLRIGLATGPADVDRARDAIARCYSVAGLEPPRFVIRLRDPIEAAIAAMLLQNGLPKAREDNRVGDQVRAQVGDQVGDQVRDQVGNQVWDQVGDQVWAQVGDQVGAQVRAQVRDQVWDQVYGNQVGAQVWDQVGDQVGAQVGDQVRAQVRDQVLDQVYGNHDAGWLGFYEFFLSEVGLACAEKLKPLMDLAEVCGWWAPYKGFAILQDRPEAINWDDQRRLHCEDGPSIRYSSGFSVYLWHGMRVPECVITCEPTMERISIETNAEYRRILIERMGYETYFEKAESKTLDRDFVPLFVGGPVMPRMLIQDKWGDRYLYGTDGSTERCYVMPVSSTAKSCREAHQSICGLDESKCIAQS